MNKFLVREVAEEININASADIVWKILTDFERFSDWNRFIQEAEGELREGCRLRLRVELSTEKIRVFHPIVTKVVEKDSLTWLSQFFIPGLFDGRHTFEIKPQGNNRVCFVQRERFSGLFVPFFWNDIEAIALQNFRIMNYALKKRAEIECYIR